MALDLQSKLRAISWAAVKRQIRTQFPSVNHLSTAELADWLQQPERRQPLLIDARAPEEYQVSHLLNARLAPNDVDELLHEIDRSTPIVVYCSIGYRSSDFAQQLQAIGYKSVFNLEGSIFEWVNEGRPVYVNGKETTQVHPYNKVWGALLNLS